MPRPLLNVRQLCVQDGKRELESKEWGTCSINRSPAGLHEIKLIGHGKNEYIEFDPRDICTRLGKGAFASVSIGTYKQRNGVGEQEETKVAIKYMSIDKLRRENPPKIDKYLIDEPRISLLLRHPNLLRTHLILEYEDPYVGTIRPMIMDLCCKENLSTYVGYCENHSLPLNDLNKMIRQIGSAIAYLQDNSILHRDIKPQNIMLLADGQHTITDFILGDFGLSAQSQLVRTNCGSPVYQAPEVIARTVAQLYPNLASRFHEHDVIDLSTFPKKYDEKADNWAFGCTVYFCIGNEALFKGVDTVEECYAKILSKNVDDHGDLYKDYVDIHYPDEDGLKRSLLTYILTALIRTRAKARMPMKALLQLMMAAEEGRFTGFDVDHPFKRINLNPLPLRKDADYTYWQNTRQDNNTLSEEDLKAAYCLETGKQEDTVLLSFDSTSRKFVAFDAEALSTSYPTEHYSRKWLEFLPIIKSNLGYRWNCTPVPHVQEHFKAANEIRKITESCWQSFNDLQTAKIAMETTVKEKVAEAMGMQKQARDLLITLTEMSTKIQSHHVRRRKQKDLKPIEKEDDEMEEDEDEDEEANSIEDGKECTFTEEEEEELIDEFDEFVTVLPSGQMDTVIADDADKEAENDANESENFNEDEDGDGDSITTSQVQGLISQLKRCFANLEDCIVAMHGKDQLYFVNTVVDFDALKQKVARNRSEATQKYFQPAQNHEMLMKQQTNSSDDSDTKRSNFLRSCFRDSEEHVREVFRGCADVTVDTQNFARKILPVLQNLKSTIALANASLSEGDELIAEFENNFELVDVSLSNDDLCNSSDLMDERLERLTSLATPNDNDSLSAPDEDVLRLLQAEKERTRALSRQINRILTSIRKAEQHEDNDSRVSELERENEEYRLMNEEIMSQFSELKSLVSSGSSLIVDRGQRLRELQKENQRLTEVVSLQEVERVRIEEQAELFERCVNDALEIASPGHQYGDAEGSKRCKKLLQQVHWMKDFEVSVEEAATGQNDWTQYLTGNKPGCFHLVTKSEDQQWILHGTDIYVDPDCTEGLEEDMVVQIILDPVFDSETKKKTVTCTPHFPQPKNSVNGIDFSLEMVPTLTSP